jgi:NodT family efflux transporter outer membrane factor (OMF) lipoprotein
MHGFQHPAATRGACARPSPARLSGVVAAWPGMSRLMAAFAVMAVAGCAVGPDYQRPAVHTGAAYAPGGLPAVTAGAAAPGGAALPGGAAENLAVGQDISADWWTVFGNRKLDDLIRRAFAQSPTIEAARATLRGAQFDVYAQLGFFAPTVSAGYSLERQQLAGNLGGNSPGVQGSGRIISTGATPGVPPYNEPVTFNLHTAQLTVGYTPDIFGSNIRQVEGLRATRNYQRLQLEAAYITLAGNMVDAALQEASLRAQLDAARAVVAENQEGLDILRHQQAAGYAMDIDVAAQEQALASAEQAVPPLEKQLAQTRDLIRVLAGGPPGEDVPERFALADFTLPASLPVSVPARLLEQRPDVRAAEEQVHMATANVGVAVAARLPVLNITGAAGGVASEFDQMFSHGGPFWNIAFAATQPVFDGFTLYNKERSARAAMAVAVAQYKSAVLTAVQNVADTLHAVTTDDRTLAAAARAETAAGTVLRATARQAADGYVNEQTLLAAQQAYQSAVATRVQAAAARFGDAAALYVALGGGWWHRTDVAER